MAGSVRGLGHEGVGGSGAGGGPGSVLLRSAAMAWVVWPADPYKAASLVQAVRVAGSSLPRWRTRSATTLCWMVMARTAAAVIQAIPNADTATASNR